MVSPATAFPFPNPFRILIGRGSPSCLRFISFKKSSLQEVFGERLSSNRQPNTFLPETFTSSTDGVWAIIQKPYILFKN
jgi:hypothetical protein